MTQTGSEMKITANWLVQPQLQRLFDALEFADEITRINGGAVRNSILNEDVRDVDLATTLLPERVMGLLEKANIKAVPTGIAHGTVTAVIDKQPFEITTLRRDIETDGRHAIVHFGKDWEEDAKRRDLTMNALYCDREGVIFDPLEGYSDVIARNVRFIGNPDQRIREDYLRILRFFRFFAQYGSGRPDGDGLKACARLKEGMVQLSVERIWQELKKILGARDPSKAILWMRTTGVLNVALPESEKWGIDFFPDLLAAENDLDWTGDALSRLKAIVPPQIAKMDQLADRLKFSAAERADMGSWAKAQLPDRHLDDGAFDKFMYGQEKPGVIARIKTEITRLRFVAHEDDGALVEAGQFGVLLIKAQNWTKPQFPLKGKDLQQQGISPGPKIGKILKSKEKLWVESGFQLSKDELLTDI